MLRGYWRDRVAQCAQLLNEGGGGGTRVKFILGSCGNIARPQHGLREGVDCLGTG